MGIKAKFHGPALAGLETTKQLNGEQSGWTVERTSYTLIVGLHSLDYHALRVEFKII